MKQEMKYDEALSELEGLVRKLEDPKCELGGISTDVKRAMELVRWCKASLKGDRDAIESLMKEEQS